MIHRKLAFIFGALTATAAVNGAATIDRCIDKVAQVTTSSTGWNEKEIETIFNQNIKQRKKTLKVLKAQKKQETDLDVRDMLALRLQKERKELKRDKKAQHAFRVIGKSKDQKNKVMASLREICTTNAKIRLLEEKGGKQNKMQASSLRAQVALKHAHLEDELMLGKTERHTA